MHQELPLLTAPTLPRQLKKRGFELLSSLAEAQVPFLKGLKVNVCVCVCVCVCVFVCVCVCVCV
jgi:hypothetical protein